MEYSLRANLKPYINVVRNSIIIAAPGVDTEILQIQSESDFLLTEIRTSGSPAGTLGLLVSIADSNGNTYNNAPWDATIIAQGTNKLVMWSPVLFPKNTQLTITFTNNTGAAIAANGFELQLIGYLQIAQ
jgi:hypothetical protein